MTIEASMASNNSIAAKASVVDLDGNTMSVTIYRCALQERTEGKQIRSSQ